MILYFTFGGLQFWTFHTLQKSLATDPQLSKWIPQNYHTFISGGTLLIKHSFSNPIPIPKLWLEQLQL